MGLIDAKGYYHGVIVDAGLSQSTNGFPQEVLALRAETVYDPDTDEYLPADAENAEITWYGVLIDSKDKETKNSQQLKKVTGWTGANFADLVGMELVDVPIAFRVEENTYKENTSLQVSWIDTLDAPPTRTVQKLDKEGVAALQQRYASVLASTKAPAKAVSAKSAAPTKTATETQAASKSATATTGKKPPTKPAGKKPPAKPKPPKTTVGKCSGDDAYNTCHSLKRDDVTTEKLNELWLAAVGEVNLDEAKVTEEQWFQIKENLLKVVSKV